jgi:cation:H+ antiporter
LAYSSHKKVPFFLSLAMLITLLTFAGALLVLLMSAKYFTESAEQIGAWLGLPVFVIGVFIVGIGTSLPELIAGIMSVQQGNSEILPGNIMGANISNIFLITGLVVILYRKTILLQSSYMYIDLHFLVGSFLYFIIIAYDGIIQWQEAIIGLLIYLAYAIYLIKGSNEENVGKNESTITKSFSLKPIIMIVIASVGIYFGADYTIQSLSELALALSVPSSIIALTLLSLGTTLPELAVNIAAVRQGKTEMAIGNVLGSSVFNTLMIPPIASFFGKIEVPHTLLQFSLPMMGAAGLLFYLLTQDKKVSTWEGWLFLCLYFLFLIKVMGW